jgi:hypothetical protein
MILRLALAALLLAAAPTLAQELDVLEGGYVVSDDPAMLPEPVRATREALIAAARSGDIKELGKLFDAQPAPVRVSFGDPEDPIEYLKQQSGDGEGVEMLAILGNLMAAPYAAFDQGDGDLGYVWPYLAYDDDITTLSPAETVDAYRIMGHDRFEEMREIGAWYYWRVYVGNDGEIQAFVAGD